MGCDEVGVAVLILDTHVFLWLLGADTRLSAQNREIIEVAAKGGDVRVPVIIAWELGMLTARSRLHLREPLVEWFQAARSNNVGPPPSAVIYEMTGEGAGPTL